MSLTQSLHAALLLVVLATASIASAGSNDQDIAAFVDSFLAKEVQLRQVPGAAIVLIRHGKPLFARSYGVADYDSGQLISIDESVFRQGSTGKMFVWTLVMQLVEEGRLDLDADIHRYLDFRIAGAFGGTITMRHLMTHTAGFADKIPLVSGETRRAPFSVRIRKNVPDRVYAPGSTIAYSNYGAALAGYIVERLRGEAFEVVVRDRILTPLGMVRSTADQPVPPHLRAALVSNYSASSRRPASFDYIGLPPAGSASASAADMGRFVAMLMNGGSADGVQILKPESVAEMMRLQRPLARGMGAGLGLGFIIGEYKGTRYAGHGGSMAAGATDFEILPEHGLAWYLAFNGRGLNGGALPLRHDLLRAVIDRFFASRSETISVGLSTARDAAGRYVPTRRVHAGLAAILGGLDPLSVRASGDGLVIELESGPTTWMPAGRDRFFEARTRLPLVVTRDETGRIVRLASPLLNGVSEYEPAPASVRFLPLLLVATAVLVAGGFVGALGWLIGAVRRSRSRPPAEAASVARLWSACAATALWLLRFSAMGWIAHLLIQIAAPGLLSRPGFTLVAVRLLSTIAVAASALIAVDVVRRLRNPTTSFRSAAGRITNACAAAGVVWMLVAFDLVL